jgi:mono/diheme cytochrome c family protein
MKRKLALTALLILVGTLPVTANAGPSGRLLYEDYRCAACHGADGRGSALDPKAKSIAGMNAGYVMKTVNQLIIEGGHDDYAGGGCGATPSDAQVQAIADYIAGMPQ